MNPVPERALQFAGQHRCHANNKRCNSKDCEYRYKKTDNRWQDGGVCPDCGTNRRCRSMATKGYNVCRMHGSGSPNINKPAGRPMLPQNVRKKYLPTRLKETYELALHDPLLIEFQRDLALQETIITDLLAQIDDTGESGQFYKRLKQTYSQFREAQATADTAMMNTCLDEWGRLLDAGAMDYSAKRQLLNWLEQRRKTINSEYIRLEKMQMMVRREQLVEFARALADIVNKQVSDVEICNRIGQDIGQLLSLVDPVMETEYTVIEE